MFRLKRHNYQVRKKVVHELKFGDTGVMHI